MTEIPRPTIIPMERRSPVQRTLTISFDGERLTVKQEEAWFDFQRPQNRVRSSNSGFFEASQEDLDRALEHLGYVRKT